MSKYLILKNGIDILSLKIPNAFENGCKIIPIYDEKELENFLKNEYEQNPDLNFEIVNYSQLEEKYKKNYNNSTTPILSLKQGDYYFVHKQENIIYIEASGSYSTLTILNENPITVTFNLAEIENRLSEEIFLRIHRSTVININYITKFIGNSIYIKDKSFPVGRKFKKKLVLRLNLLGNSNKLFCSNI